MTLIIILIFGFQLFIYNLLLVVLQITYNVMPDKQDVNNTSNYLNISLRKGTF